LNKDPSKRLGCHPQLRWKQVKAHPWFGGVDWEAHRQRTVPPPFVPDPNVANFSTFYVLEDQIIGEDLPTPLSPKEQVVFRDFEHSTDPAIAYAHARDPRRSQPFPLHASHASALSFSSLPAAFPHHADVGDIPLQAKECKEEAKEKQSAKTTGAAGEANAVVPDAPRSSEAVGLSFDRNASPDASPDASAGPSLDVSGGDSGSSEGESGQEQ